MKNKFLEVTQEAGADLFKRNIQGEIVMLNLLRFRQIADYSANPELAQTWISDWVKKIQINISK